MDSKEDDIDFKKLERELAAAVEADKKYFRENAAKFRAVEQKVGSYEEFRNIVLASNLQPLERKDIEGVKSKQQTLNPLCSVKQRADNSLKTSTRLGEADTKQQSETVDAFVKHWKRHSKTSVERYEQVVSLNEQNINKIMASELLGNLLGEVLVAFNECFKEDDTSKIVASLHSLSMNKRFKLNLQFLTKKEEKATGELIVKLIEKANDCNIEALHNIKSAFRVS